MGPGSARERRQGGRSSAQFPRVVLLDVTLRDYSSGHHAGPSARYQDGRGAGATLGMLEGEGHPTLCRSRSVLMTDRIERLMVVTAHPDDAEFGAGGTVARFAQEGCEITYVVVTKGDKGSSDRSMTAGRLATI